MNDLNLFCNIIIKNNPKIVEYHLSNPEEVDYYTNEEHFDRETLVFLIEAMRERMEMEELKPYIKTKLLTTMIGMILAVRKLQENSQINNDSNKTR